jgi:hypothetical protein
MAKEIIALSTSSNGTTVFYTVAFWYPITSGLKPVSSVSQWGGASAAENSAITAGSVIEEVNSFQFAIGTPVATIKTVLQQWWTARNTQLGGVGPNSVFGVFFDSVTGWSA